MFARGVIVLLCVLVAVSDAARAPNCKPNPKPKPKLVVCTMDYSPVCGSNGITYNNECLLCAAIEESNTEIFKVKQGRCDDDMQEDTGMAA